jgi:glutaredoxin
MITIYSLDNCGYCKVAKELLKFKKVEYTEIKVPDNMSSRDFVIKYPTVKSFPYIINGTSEKIGGFSDLQEWLLAREKKLALNKISEQLGDMTL